MAYDTWLSLMWSGFDSPWRYPLNTNSNHSKFDFYLSKKNGIQSKQSLWRSGLTRSTQDRLPVRARRFEPFWGHQLMIHHSNTIKPFWFLLKTTVVQFPGSAMTARCWINYRIMINKLFSPLWSNGLWYMTFTHVIGVRFPVAVSFEYLQQSHPFHFYRKKKYSVKQHRWRSGLTR